MAPAGQNLEVSWGAAEREVQRQETTHCISPDGLFC